MTEELKKRLEDIINSYRVMLFMKWTPEVPACWFSANAVALLVNNDIYFESFDVYSDEDIRQGLKQYSWWPTYPQLYIDGELIWWIDILTDMHENKELSELKKEKKL